ncbi:MAG: HAMP domain-containing histidine kinase [Saprospiraceae bacterium]|nr:HAMP domain-containing histidine kinase [Saprospiraceae bacterium]
MKLLQKSNRLFLGFLLIGYLITGIVLFVAIRSLINIELDELLQEKTVYLEAYLQNLDNIPQSIQVTDELVEIRTVANHQFFEAYQDTSIWNIIDDEMEPYRSYTRSMIIREIPIVVKISNSKIESEDLITTMGLVLLSLLTLIFLGIYFITRKLSGKLWKPFHSTLDQLKSFDFRTDSMITAEHTDVEEFQMLNASLQQMSAKLTKDFQALKSFAENASHEIQTPLSVIKNNIELIIQQNNRSPDEWNRLEEINKAATRISKIQKALLLLTAIENKQYTDTELINLRLIIQEKLSELDARLQDKDISVELTGEDASVAFNPHLMDIMIGNLLSNAIKHNHHQGSITIELSANQLLITNTGRANYIEDKRVFNRFVKGDPSSGSLGLGLAIVKQICDAYDVVADYSSKNGQHQISISFPLRLVA